jgi:hypothetical protein
MESRGLKVNKSPTCMFCGWNLFHFFQRILDAGINRETSLVLALVGDPDVTLMIAL